MAATKKNIVVDEPHRKRLVNTLMEFRKTNHLTDISIKFKNKEITAHRLILSAASEVFAAMFQADMRESVEGRVDLSAFDIDDNVADDFIEYMYSGLLFLTENNVEGILGCANYFMMAELKEVCSDFLHKSLRIKNCLDIFIISSRYQCYQLKEKCLNMICEKFAEVTEEENFLLLSYQSIISLLSEDSLEISSEDVVFYAYVRWLQHDWEARSKYFQGIFKCVRLQYLSNQCFELLKTKPYAECLKSDVANMLYFDENGNKAYEVANIFPRQCLDTSSVIMTTGGYDGNSCLISSFAFSLNNNKWVHLAPMQTSRHDHGTVSLANDLFVVGGFNSRNGPLNSTEHYNSMRNEWKAISPMNSKRKSLGICVFQGKIFVSGGLDESYNALETVEYFDEDQCTWVNFIPMNQPRYNHGFVASNDHGIFSIGGWKNLTVERFSDGQWSMIRSMSSCRAGAASVIHHDKIYVFGGYSEYQCISTIEIYDINDNIWYSGAPGSIARWRAGCAMSENLIYVIGGRDSSWQYLDVVEIYNTEKDEWDVSTTLPCKMMGLRCSVVRIPKHTIHHGTIQKKL